MKRLLGVETPVICAPLHRPKVSRELLESFGNIDLVDSYRDVSEVSIVFLVGINSEVCEASQIPVDSSWSLLRLCLFGLCRVGSSLLSVSLGTRVSRPSLLSVSLGTPVSHQLSSVHKDTLGNFWDLESRY